MSDTDLDTMLVKAAQDGRANEIAASMMAMGVLAGLLFLDDAIKDDGTLAPDDQTRCHEKAMLVKAKAVQFGQIAADKLCASQPQDTRDALRDSIACAVTAIVMLEITAMACGGNPTAARGMVLMAADGIRKDAMQKENGDE